MSHSNPNRSRSGSSGDSQLPAGHGTPEDSASPDPQRELEAIYGAELVGLLDELADQDGRRLLSRLASWKGPRTTSVSDRLSPGSSFLSRLERHLLAVYRDELGALVEESCLELFLTERAWAGQVQPNRDDQGRAILARGLVERRAERDRLQSLVGNDPPAAPALQLLNRLLGGSPRRKSELLVFALAGATLRPSDAMAIYIAKGFQAVGDLEEANRRLRAVFHGPARYERRIVAANHLGLVAEAKGDQPEALQWFRRAAVSKIPQGAKQNAWALSAASWATGAIYAGNLQGAQSALELLAERFDPQDPAILEHCRRLRAERLAGTWVPSEDQIEPVLSKLVDDHEHTNKIRAIFL